MRRCRNAPGASCRRPSEMAMQDDKLIRMADQIARFFATQPGPDQAERVAAHLHDFWDPRMREAFRQIVESGRAEVHPLARAAILSLPVAEAQTR